MKLHDEWWEKNGGLCGYSASKRAWNAALEASGYNDLLKKSCIRNNAEIQKEQENNMSKYESLEEYIAKYLQWNTDNSNAIPEDIKKAIREYEAEYFVRVTVE